jgi:peptide/nickel transport system substrate-binding protein
MKRGLRVLMAAGLLSLTFFAVGAAFAQKAGGILKISHFDSPASMSLLEESTTAAIRPAMGVFNNLVVYDQNVSQNSMLSIVPELATGWSTNEEGTELIFPLRKGVKWHDGKPFTAQDVKCTWDLLAGKTNEKLRINPRRSWYGKRRRGDPKRRFPGHLPAEAAAAGSLGITGFRLGGDLSLPCQPTRHAQLPDWHWSV